jgi:type IV secretory pathway VirB4 component
VVSGWLDRLIQINEPYVDVVLYVETLDPKHFADRLTRKLTGFRATQAIEARAGRTENPYIEAAREEVEELRDKIVRQEEKVHSVSLYLAARATSIPELRQRDEKIISLLRGLDVESVETSLEHLQAWQTMLPDARDVLKRRKVLDTSSLVTAFPFGSTSLSTEPGILTGVTPDGSMVIVNPFSTLLENANEVKFAKSGSGKSFDEKVRLSRFLQMGIHCIVVDPENEFERLREAYNGTSISLSAGRLALNPFAIAPADAPERDILEEKISSLLTLFDLLLADRMSDRATSVLTQKEKSLLEVAIRHAYDEAGISAKTITHDREPPTMVHISTYLKQGVAGRDSIELADRLHRFVNAFPRETDRHLLDNPLVVFSLRDLPDDLRPVALFLISEYVWTQVRRERHPRPRLLSIDEAWTLLQFDAGGRALAALARRARKYNLGVRITTQLVNDFLASESGQAILANANKFVLKTDAANIDAVTTALKLTDGERKFLLGAKKGEGLYFLGQAQGQTRVPMTVVASRAEYDMANTNAQELRQQGSDSFEDAPHPFVRRESILPDDNQHAQANYYRQQEIVGAAKYTLGRKLRPTKPYLMPMEDQAQ